ncbi:MAG: DUF1269 domain-containing protein [Anaerolineae bacterium]|nr:DUF1269 domain-containing protein [Anaerolineae bacterium]
MMSNLIVVTFDDPEEASRLRKTLSGLQGHQFLSLDDTAVIVKDKDGQIYIRNEIDRGIKIGFAGGGFLGLLIGMLFGFPLIYLVIGAVGGAITGSLADLGIHQDFVHEVSSKLKPGSSALFVIVRNAEPDVAVAALQPYRGTGHIIQTTLPTEAEDNLRSILEKHRSFQR